jgi:carbon storage regulator CsrA
MLVLSRKTKQTIVLPSLGITVHVLGVKKGSVRLGIEAPPEVPVFRGELPVRTDEWAAVQAGPQNGAEGVGVGPDVRLKGHLTTTGVGLGLLRLQLDAGLLSEAKETLVTLQEGFQILLHGIAGESESRQTEPSSAQSRRHKALLVEDNTNERELLASFLRQSGLEVDTAGDGADALDYLHSRRTPDVVLLDMGLPRMDGPTAVREIRRDPAFAGLKIFGVTGRLPDEFNLARGPEGVDRWFYKPLDPAALVRDLNAEMAAPI